MLGHRRPPVRRRWEKIHHRRRQGGVQEQPARAARRHSQPGRKPNCAPEPARATTTYNYSTSATTPMHGSSNRPWPCWTQPALSEVVLEPDRAGSDWGQPERTTRRTSHRRRRSQPPRLLPRRRHGCAPCRVYSSTSRCPAPASHPSPGEGGHAPAPPCEKTRNAPPPTGLCPVAAGREVEAVEGGLAATARVRLPPGCCTGATREGGGFPLRCRGASSNSTAAQTK